MKLLTILSFRKKMLLDFYWSSLAVEGGKYLDVKLDCSDGCLLSNKCFLSLLSCFEYLGGYICCLDYAFFIMKWHFCSLDIDYDGDVNLIMCDFTIKTITKLFNGYVVPQPFKEVSKCDETRRSITKDLEEFNDKTANEDTIRIESFQTDITDVQVPLKELSDKLDVNEDKSRTCLEVVRDGSQEHICPICGKLFTSRKSYKMHEYQVHPEGQQNKFKCTHTDCYKTFAYQFMLRKHIKVCHSEHADCNYCNKTFKSQKSLKRHVKSKHSTL